MYFLFLSRRWFGLPINKVKRILRSNTINRTRLIAKRYAVALIRHKHNLRSERGADELRTGFVGDGLEQRCDGGTVLRVEVGVYFVKDDHGAALRLLEGKDEAQRAQT